MAKNENKNKTADHLKKEVVDMQEKLRIIRFGGAGSRSRNVKEGRNLRRDIARALTELRARAMSAAAQTTSAAAQTTSAAAQAIASKTKKA